MNCYALQMLRLHFGAWRQTSGLRQTSIFLDINMPRMNWLKCLYEIHKSEKVQFSEVTMVVVLTNLTAELQIKSKELPCVRAFNHKLMTADELATLLNGRSIDR